MSVAGHCRTCGRELLLGQLISAVDGFRCPFCGQALAPSYASVAPAVTARLLAAHAELQANLGQLQAMAGENLRLDRASLVGPIDEQLGQTTRTG